MAVLIRAIQDFFILRASLEKPRKNNGWGRHQRYHGIEKYAEIERYFYDRSLDREPFSFFRMCEVMSDEPEYIRRKILDFLENSDFKSFYHTKAGRCGFVTIVTGFLSNKITGCENNLSD